MFDSTVVISKDADVRELAIRIGRDIGGVKRLTTANKANIVAAINEIKTTTDAAGKTYATKDDVTKLATKTELSAAIANLINGADVNSDTLKELADKIISLAQADNGLVSAVEVQSFTEQQKKKARDNIEAISAENIVSLVADSSYISIYEQSKQ